MVLSTAGLVADAYDIAIINLVRPSLEVEFGMMTPFEDGMITGATVAGAIVGQVLFGVAADRLGRRPVFIMTSALIGFGSIACAMARPGFLGLSVYNSLGVCRFVLGLGIGGEYPLSAASTAENMSSKTSGQALALTFSGLAVGQVIGPILVIVLDGGLSLSAEMVWRCAFGFGAALAAVMAVLRILFLEETAAYRQQQEVEQQAETGSADASDDHWAQLAALRAMPRSMAGCAGSWFLYDICTYGVGQFSTVIFPAAPGVETAKILLIITTFAVPGVIGAIMLTPLVCMRQLQMTGAFLMLTCFVVLGMMSSFKGVSDAHRSLALFVFATLRCFDTMGPGVTTFAIPGQIFPTRIRASAHGLSAAAGKVGGVVGIFIFPYLREWEGMQALMRFMALVCAATLGWTWCFTPSYGPAQLDEIAQHDGGVPIERQAAIAERMLFEAHSKREAEPFAPVLAPPPVPSAGAP